VVTLENSLGAAGDLVRVLFFDGAPVGDGKAIQRRRLDPEVYLGLGMTTVVVSITRTAETTGDPAEAEAALRQELAAELTLEGISAALDHVAMRAFGDFSIGGVEINLGDGSDVITETASPTVSPGEPPTEAPNLPSLSPVTSHSHPGTRKPTISTSIRPIPDHRTSSLIESGNISLGDTPLFH